MAEYTTTSEQETISLAEAIAKQLRGGDVLALTGPLGSGKTRFVRGLVRGLGLDEQSVSSPTFLICQVYHSPVGSEVLSLAHIDAYRLRDADELDTIGWDEMLDRDDMIIAVEWADRIERDLPGQCIRVEFEHAGETERRLCIIDADANEDRFSSLATAGHSDKKPCPICSTPVQQSNETFPFCSPRCRMVDLGKWFSGSRVISRPLREDDFEQL